MTTKTLRVRVVTPSKKDCEDMVTALARAACDIANSYEGVHIWIDENVTKNRMLITNRSVQK